MMNLKPIGRTSGPAPLARERGAAVMPIIIAVAVAITLLQVPMLYKTKSGNKFSGAQKSNISAKSLAEAGIDQVITDIGRKSLRVSAATDTMPYDGVSLGRGTFTTKVRAYQINPDRVEVVSTGQVGANAQSVRARMELVKTEATIPFDTPRISLWGIRGTPPVLYYHSLDERDSGRAWIFPEGRVVLPGVPVLNVDDFTVAPNGTDGTDHGRGGVALLLGGAVAGGKVHGRWPGLAYADRFEGRDLMPTTDTRALFKGLLRDHLGVAERALDADVFPDSASVKPLPGLVRGT